MTGRRWSDSQIETLRGAVATGERWDWIASQVGRTKSAVISKAKSLGVSRRIAWSNRIYAAIQARGMKETWEDVAKQAGVGLSTLHAHRKRIGHHRSWLIYEIKFPYVERPNRYIGQTVRLLRERISKHRSESDTPVGRLLRQGHPHRVRILDRCETQREADKTEQAMIRSFGLDSLLNQIEHAGYFRTRPLIAGQKRRCTWCHKTKPLDAFAKDRSKNGGVGYKCRCCYGLYSRICYHFRQTTPDYAKAYRLARKWCANGDNDLYGKELRRRLKEES